MTWNPFHQRGETPRDRAEQIDRIERQVRKGLTARASEPSPAGPATSPVTDPEPGLTVDPRDRAAFVRRIKAVLAA